MPSGTVAPEYGDGGSFSCHEIALAVCIGCVGTLNPCGRLDGAHLRTDWHGIRLMHSEVHARGTIIKNRGIALLATSAPNEGSTVQFQGSECVIAK